MHFIKLFLLFFLLSNSFFSQSFKGVLTAHANQSIMLYSYDGFKLVKEDSAVISKEGFFQMKLPLDYIGMGFIKTSDNSSISVFMEEQDFSLKGVHLKELKTLKFSNSIQNSIHLKYINEHLERENLLAGWKYLLKTYIETDLYKKDVNSTKFISDKIQEIEKDDADFVSSLQKGSYCDMLIPKLKLISDVPLSAKYYTDRIDENIESFRSINYADKRLLTSGILDELIESHYWLIENSGRPLDSVYLEMNISIDRLIENLENDKYTLNIVVDFLFDLLEKHSLFKASEYLAVRVLTNNSCSMDKKIASQLEIYREMKVGNIAKDISNVGGYYKKGEEINQEFQLKSIESDYTLVAFGASWCPKCSEEVEELQQNYTNWKNKGVEVLFVGLDSDKEEFLKFSKYFPWYSICDFKGWNTNSASDYHVFSSPTFFLLDRNREIILRPFSVSQVSAWVDYYLK